MEIFKKPPVNSIVEGGCHFELDIKPAPMPSPETKPLKERLDFTEILRILKESAENGSTEKTPEREGCECWPKRDSEPFFYPDFKSPRIFERFFMKLFGDNQADCKKVFS